LAQSRGAILAAFFAAAETLDSIFDQDKIFEYSPNLIKSSVSGFGHADKLAMQKALNMILGKQSYITHDASDATAAAVCHYLHRNSLPVKMESHLIKQKSLYKKKRSLAQSLDHMLKEG
jgi:crossover junction endodeoxyribonuclease RuvC